MVFSLVGYKMGELLLEKVGIPALQQVCKLVLGEVCGWLDKDALSTKIKGFIESDSDRTKESFDAVRGKELHTAILAFKEG